MRCVIVKEGNRKFLVETPIEPSEISEFTNEFSKLSDSEKQKYDEGTNWTIGDSDVWGTTDILAFLQYLRQKTKRKAVLVGEISGDIREIELM